jgi:hypothetical protein
MGNTSRRKPKPTPREPGGAPISKPAPPRFAVVRVETKGAVEKIEIYNLDHVVHVVAHVLGEEHAIELWTLGDLAVDDTGRKPAPITLTGKAAADMLAHLILCGIDVEGAPAALARARGDLYASYFKGTATSDPEPGDLGGLPDPDDADPGACKGCAFQFVEPCAGWIPGGLDDACGAFEAAPTAEEEIGQTRQSTIDERACRLCLYDYECVQKPRSGKGCELWHEKIGPAQGCSAHPAPPISVEEHAAELRAMRQVEKAHAAARSAELDAALGAALSPAAGPIAAVEVERIAVMRSPSDTKTAGDARKAAALAAYEVAKASATAAAEKMNHARTCADCVRMTRTDCKPDKPNGICERFEVDPRKVAAERVNFAKAARLVCQYGEKCERFPACADCSLYALGERHEPADPHHVEEVTGEHRDVLAERVGRCGVFVGMQKRGVEIGKQWCGVGHEMTDPACALCPYLRIASR